MLIPLKKVCRILTCLPYLGWGALAITQALEGWSTLVVGGGSLFFLTVCGLLLPGVPWKRFERSFIGRLAEYVLVGPLVVTAVILPFLVSQHLGPVGLAVWAGLLTASFVVLLYSPWWLARYTATIVSFAIAMIAVISTSVFVVMSYIRRGSLIAGMAVFPSLAAQVAAVVLAASTPVGLWAAWWILRTEVAGSRMRPPRGR